MKKVLYLTVGCALAFASCTEFDFDANRDELIKENAENIFGMIDPKQDWSNVTSGTITVTADASLKNIAKVQILTESPFLNDQARILAEVDATKGEVVTLNYDAPKTNSRLIAACVDNNGNYYVKGFNVGDGTISFKNASATRAGGSTRASSELPDLSTIELKYSDSFLSYNANRALSNDAKFSIWKGKNWEKDRLWWPTGPENSNGWTISNSTIFREATAFSDDDKATLQDIFNASLYRDDPKGVNGRRNNLALIREGNAVKFFSNHLVSNGKAPLTLSPVQLASTEAYWCDIYYYYYKIDDVPSGTSETDYIKSLPKFKAIDLNDERQAFQTKTNKRLSERDENFLRLHEYLLPYYGEASEFEQTTSASMLSKFGYTTNGKFYRIYNYSGKSDAKPNPIPESNHYITYGTNGSKTENLKDEYTDNIEYQLWQIFTNATDNTVMLYNVGSKKFFWWNNGDYVEMKDITENSLKNYTVYITDGAKKPYAINDITKQKVFILSAYKNNFIKAMIDTDRAYLYKGGTNISGTYKVAREWTFEEYTVSSATAITDFELPIQYFPASDNYNPTHATASAIIPEGYRVGFMIRKDNGKKTEEMGNDKRGCLYGCGELNKEINTFGQFKSAVELYGMKENDPRMATFTANGKTYLCFEEGADTQYSDVIIEIGGVSTTQVRKAIAEEPDDSNKETIIDDDNNEGESGVYMFDDLEEVSGMPYTMCFEDRPQEADYDMNDVVLRCIRYQGDAHPNRVYLSLVATGADDNVFIKGIEGTLVSGTDLNDKEVHDLFGVTDEKGDYRFVNTLVGQAAPIGYPMGIYDIDPSLSIPQFLSKIYIENKTTGLKISVPKKGEAPYVLIIPGDFNYPREGQSIINTYTNFRTWANKAAQYGDWLNWFDESKIFTNPNNK